MSSKRKSPPTKLQEGNSVTDSGKDSMAACVAETGALFRPEDGGEGGEAGEGVDSASSRSSLSGSDAEDAVTPPCKKQRGSPMSEHSFLAPQTSLWNLQQQYERFHQANHFESQRRRAECSSPVLNNNTICTNNNNSAKRPVSMDDVLKRLTSKMNHSTLADDRRPTPASTPNNPR